MEYFAITAAVLLCLGIGFWFGKTWGSRSRDHTAASTTMTAQQQFDQGRLDQGLMQLQHQVSALSQHGSAWQAQLQQQVEHVHTATRLLSQETAGLRTALRRPQVRGTWGELHLQKTVELAGLAKHCDFNTQTSFSDWEGRLRPDMIVNLPGERHIIVDAKVPLDAYLAAIDTDDETAHNDQLRAHARQLRTHIDDLAKRRYHQLLANTPEFVVLFLPAESFLSAALSADHTLLEYGADKQVIIATPTTLIALLRTVAHGWSTQALTEQTQQIQALGHELHRRLAIANQHLADLGHSLNKSVEAYNSHVGSLETRALVTARKFGELNQVSDPLPALNPLEVTPRPITAPELGADAS